MTTPSVGRIVHVLVDPATNNGADAAPAIITRVFHDTMVNVRVLLDGSEQTPAKTSVSLHPDRAAVDAARAQLAADRGVALADVTMHAAYWPARV